MPTAQDLLDGDVQYKSPAQRLRESVLQQLEAAREELPEGQALQALFPNAVMDDDLLDEVVTNLISGGNLLILGPPGSGKTTLAKDIWRLYPKEIAAVADCPVQDDPFSVVDPEVAEAHPPCPYCRANYGASEDVGEFDASEVDPADVLVETKHLREGHGFARVQGSPEVFPDNLTGAVNLARLEEVGDPNSPLVLEPGKLLQANRGVLMVDEIGKLPRGTQNVLLQALQESTVTPAKSRETFPGHFVAVATSNLPDLANIGEALNDRLNNVYMDFNEDHQKNVEIVRNALGDGAAAAAPQLYLHAATRLVEAWRSADHGFSDLAEVGSNRTMVDVVRRAEAQAAISDRALVSPDDFARGARAALRSRIRARGGDSFEENRRVVEKYVDSEAPSALQWGAKTVWCRFYESRLEGNEGRAREAANTLRKGEPVPEFTEWVEDKEPPGVSAEEVFQLLDDAGAFRDDGE
jgi:MoxR-like ATPase